jgi:hypothetical protein
MKILSLALLLMASLAFVLLGCTDNSSPVEGSTDQALSTAAPPTSLAKVAVERSVTGTANIWINGKMGVLTINAHKCGDVAKGNFNMVSTVYNPKDGTVRGEVVAVTFYENYSFSNGVSGPTALVWFRGSYPELFNGKYLACFFVDNGQGKNALAPDYSDGPDGPYDAMMEDMTPQDIADNYPEWFLPIDVGNIVIH